MQRHNEQKLREAFEQSKDVFLIFSVNSSGHFQGYARMVSIGQGQVCNVVHICCRHVACRHIFVHMMHIKLLLPILKLLNFVLCLSSMLPAFSVSIKSTLQKL